MNITTIEEMEKIVSQNDLLMWDGWTVVHSYPSEKARMSKFGALVNGNWHMQKRFSPSRNGWEIPDKFVR